MARRSFIANFLLTGSFAFSATVSAQTSSIEGNVVDTDGRPLKNAEIRFDQKGKIPAIATRTDVNGHYTPALPMGFYKMSGYRTWRGKIRPDCKGDRKEFAHRFRPATIGRKADKTLCWVGEGTRSHLPGRWVKAGIRATRSPTH